jgi:hypothetical protein
MEPWNPSAVEIQALLDAINARQIPPVSMPQAQPLPTPLPGGRGIPTPAPLGQVPPSAVDRFGRPMVPAQSDIETINSRGSLTPEASRWRSR